METNELKRAILDAMLPDVPFDGWSVKSAAAAAKRAGLDPSDVARAFPGGTREIIEFWSASADEDLLEALKSHDLAAMRIRERIALAVRLRLEAATPHKEALRRAISILAFPGQTGLGARMLYRTIDTIWFGIGDRSADFSFYTKRGLLAAVYSSTLLYWLEDRSEDSVDSWAFLDRRIATIMQIPKLKSRVKTAAGRLPNPLRLIPKRPRFVRPASSV